MYIHRKKKPKRKTFHPDVCLQVNISVMKSTTHGSFFSFVLQKVNEDEEQKKKKRKQLMIDDGLDLNIKKAYMLMYTFSHDKDI